jgi:uncharacterized protein (TIGR00725 family)
VEQEVVAAALEQRLEGIEVRPRELPQMPGPERCLDKPCVAHGARWEPRCIHAMMPLMGVAAQPRYVAVVGAGGEVSAEMLTDAEALGAELARQGAVVVTGGLGGIMEAACRGAHREGGLTLGILPGDDRRAANRWVSVAVATGMGELRNGLVVRSSDAVIAVAGEYGTLSEIALALKAGKPVVGIGTWEIAGVRRAPDAMAAVALALAAAR